MSLTAREKEQLLVTVAADLAKRRLKRGIRLDYAQAVALITFELREWAGDGRSLDELERHGVCLLRKDQVMRGIPELVRELSVTIPFQEGTATVTLRDPIR